MTSFLLSTDINEGGKFELTAPISVKEKKKDPSILQYRILGESVWKIDGSECSSKKFEKGEVKTFYEDERYEKYGVKISSTIVGQTKANCCFSYERWEEA